MPYRLRVWTRVVLVAVLTAPKLDGDILLCDADRQSFAADYGGHVKRLPLAHSAA
jgi:hypothetical protein